MSEAKSGLALLALLVRLALGVVDAVFGLPKPGKLEKFGNQFAVLAVLVRVVLAGVVAVAAFVVLLELGELVSVDVCEPAVVPVLLVAELLPWVVLEDGEDCKPEVVGAPAEA